MTKLTKAARGKECTVRIPGHCNFSTDTTVTAHLNGIRYGHGTGQKVSDILGADCCSDCHAVLDGRQRCDLFTRKELKLFHLEGVMETILRRIEEGLIKV